MPALTLALTIGIVAGMRTMTAPAAIAWAAAAGWLVLAGTPLAWLGWWGTPWIFTALAIGEYIADKLPNTPSRKRPGGFIARLVAGALCGAAIGLAANALLLCIVVAVVGAVIGTLADMPRGCGCAGRWGLICRLR